MYMQKTCWLSDFICVKFFCHFFFWLWCVKIEHMNITPSGHQSHKAIYSRVFLSPRRRKAEQDTFCQVFFHTHWCASSTVSHLLCVQTGDEETPFISLQGPVIQFPLIPCVVFIDTLYTQKTWTPVRFTVWLWGSIARVCKVSFLERIFFLAATKCFFPLTFCHVVFMFPF